MRHKKNSYMLEKLSQENRQNLIIFVNEIKELLELQPKSNILTIDEIGKRKEGIVRSSDTRIRLIKFLIENGVIKKATQEGRGRYAPLSPDYYVFLIHVDRDKLNELLIEMSKIDLVGSSLQQNISKLPTQKSFSENNDVVYRIEYDSRIRKIIINNFVYKQLASFGENEGFFSFVYNNPNKKLLIKEIDNHILKECGEKRKKSVQKILENIGFSGNLKKIFFPNASNKGIEFINPINKDYFAKLSIDLIKIEDLLSK